MKERQPRKRSKQQKGRSEIDWGLQQALKAPDEQNKNNKKEKKVVMVRVPHQTWRKLKHVAADNDTSIQKLAVEGLDYILIKYGMEP